MGVPGWIALGLMLWYRRYPNPAQEPDVIGQAGALMTGWLPLVVVSATSLLSAVMLLVLIVKRWKNGQLRVQVESLESDLKLERDGIETLKQEHEKTVKALERDCKKAQDDLVEADKRTRAQENQKEDVLAELRKREEDLAELKTLRALRETQAGSIKDHVVITGVNPIELILESNAESGPCVTFTLFIRNESLYNIAIRPDEVKGCLAFANQQLQERVIVVRDAWTEPIENLVPLAPASIVLRQPLRGFEVDRIKSLPEGQFWLAPLRIPITAHGQYKVPSKNLRITPEVQYLPVSAFCNTKSLDSKD